MSISTDEMYNSNSRYLHKRYLIYFSSSNVLEVLKENYLISSTLLEEACKVSSSPFGEVTSNELELSILNLEGIFNPKNTESPYYGLIKKGLKIEAFIRPDEASEWDQMGTFYVKDWTTSSSGMTAEIVANDALYTILNSPVPFLGIARDVKFSDFMQYYFSLFDLSVTVDQDIDLVIPYAFTSGYSDNRKLLADLMLAAMADCYCIHDGSIIIKGKTSPRELRATLTDDDQIVTISIKQEISTDYDSASVTCNKMQESSEINILSIDALKVVPGVNTTELTNFSKEKVVRVNGIRVESDAAVKPISFSATADNIVCTLRSTSGTEAKLSVTGTILEKVSSVVSTEGVSSVTVDSIFVQTLENANSICAYTDEYVNEAVPTVTLAIRGNPKLSVGDKIEIDSNKYKISYTGLIQKLHYTYSGGLTCEMTLVADMTKEV